MYFQQGLAKAPVGPDEQIYLLFDNLQLAGNKKKYLGNEIYFPKNS